MSLLLAVVGLAAAAESEPRPTLPEPTAGVLVGAVVSRFDEPSGPADLAASLGSFVDASGRLQAGGAVEVGVRAFGLTPNLTPDQYRQKYLKRVLANTFVSMATAEDPDTGTLKAAVGARMTLFQDADPYLDEYYQALARQVAESNCDRFAKGDSSVEALQAQDACDRAIYDLGAERLERVRWNQTGTVLSIGSSIAFPDGRLSGAGGEDLAAWLSQSFRVREHAQLGLSGGWTHALSDDGHVLSGGGLVRGAVGRTRLRGEFGVDATLPHGRDGWQVLVPVLVGAEYQIEKGAWLAVDFGMRFDPGADEVSLLSQGTFRWGTARKPRFAGAEG